MHREYQHQQDFYCKNLNSERHLSSGRGSEAPAPPPADGDPLQGRQSAEMDPFGGRR